jgi:hypothetical protein
VASLPRHTHVYDRTVNESALVGSQSCSDTLEFSGSKTVSGSKRTFTDLLTTSVNQEREHINSAERQIEVKLVAL